MEFTDPDAFDVGRSPNRHLSYGVGLHYCVGAHLASQQLECVIEWLSLHVAAIDLLGVPEVIPDPWVDGFSKLEVRLVSG
jgi:linalool 8-monooxygenase